MSDPITGLVVLRADELAAVVRAAVAAALAEHEPAGVPTLLDREGCARLLGISVGTVDRLRREGLPRVRVGDVDRFEAAEVLGWLRGRAR